MLEKTKEKFLIEFAESKIKIEHNRENMESPSFIKYKGEIVAKDFINYVGKNVDKNAIVRHSKGHKEAGIDTVEISGYLPVDSEIHFHYKMQYLPNHCRISTDILLHKNSVVQRHFGIGSFFLCGNDWTAYHLTPPAKHLEEGAKVSTHKIPKFTGEKMMIGHWHRPPTTLVFERKDGFCFEVSTGFDVWRWENCLNFAPESGSYKLFLTENGIEIVREVLACCEDFTPVSGQYRYCWYMAWFQKDEFQIAESDLENVVWVKPMEPELPEIAEKVGIDLSLTDWQESFCRISDANNFSKKVFEKEACFAHSKVQGYLKTTLRRIRAKNPQVVYIKGLNIGNCCNGSHVNKNGKVAYHNDSTYILDFIEWVQQAFKDTCEVKVLRNENSASYLDFQNKFN